MNEKDKKIYLREIYRNPLNFFTKREFYRKYLQKEY